MSASKNLGKVFMTPKGIWDKTLNYTKLDIVTNKVGKISCGYIATTDIEKNIEITDNRWLKLFELLDGDLTEEYKAVQMDVANKATDVDANKKAVDLIYSQMQKLYDVEISTTTPTNERTGLWINPDDISGVINIPEIKDNEVSDVDTWSSKKIDNVTGSLKEDISTKITKFYASSQGETHLADSDDGKIQDMMVYGKSEQKQYSGKNLFDKSTSKSAWISDDGIYMEKGEIGENTDVVSDYISVKENSTYIASFKTNYAAKFVYWYTYNANKEFVSITKIVNKITIPTGIRYVRVMISMQQQYCVAVNDELQVELGTEPTTYEPYTGGIPSPNPDYPQEIKSVVNPRVKVCGKNLLKVNESIFPFTKGGVTFTYDKSDGAIVMNGTTDEPMIPDILFTAFTDASKKYALSRKTANNSQFIVIGNVPSNDNFYSNSNATDILNGGKYSIKMYFDKAISFSNERFYIQLEEGSTSTAYEPYHEQTVALPYTLNAIPVSSGGNVTIGSQEYVSDYVDVERGKLVRMVGECIISDMNQITRVTTNTFFVYGIDDPFVINDGNDDIARLQTNKYQGVAATNRTNNKYFYRCWMSTHDNNKPIAFHSNTDDLSAFKNEVYGTKILYQLATPEETDLTSEEVQAFKALATYYPITNISINSEQLDGYTVFNYPISMENGWNYVKQQIGDTRDYIYDIDARTQDTDLQAAEAYVNSEYAVALTELEV